MRGHVKKHKRMLFTEFAFRGNRHSKNMWKELLPSAKQKLIDKGLFNKDGSITEKGLNSLKKGVDVE